MYFERTPSRKIDNAPRNSISGWSAQVMPALRTRPYPYSPDMVPIVDSQQSAPHSATDAQANGPWTRLRRAVWRWIVRMYAPLTPREAKSSSLRNQGRTLTGRAIKQQKSTRKSGQKRRLGLLPPVARTRDGGASRCTQLAKVPAAGAPRHTLRAHTDRRTRRGSSERCDLSILILSWSRPCTDPNQCRTPAQT